MYRLSEEEKQTLLNKVFRFQGFDPEIIQKARTKFPNNKAIYSLVAREIFDVIESIYPFTLYLIYQIKISKQIRVENLSALPFFLSTTALNLPNDSEYGVWNLDSPNSVNSYIIVEDNKVKCEEIHLFPLSTPLVIKSPMELGEYILINFPHAKSEELCKYILENYSKFQSINYSINPVRMDTLYLYCRFHNLSLNSVFLLLLGNISVPTNHWYKYDSNYTLKLWQNVSPLKSNRQDGIQEFLKHFPLNKMGANNLIKVYHELNKLDDYLIQYNIIPPEFRFTTSCTSQEEFDALYNKSLNILYQVYSNVYDGEEI